MKQDSRAIHVTLVVSISFFGIVSPNTLERLPLTTGVQTRECPGLCLKVKGVNSDVGWNGMNRTTMFYYNSIQRKCLRFYFYGNVSLPTTSQFNLFSSEFSCHTICELNCKAQESERMTRGNTTLTQAGREIDTWQRVEGNLIQISFDGATLVGTQASGSFVLATENLKTTPNWRQIPGNGKQIVVHGDRMFHMNENNDIWIATFATPSTVPNWSTFPNVDSTRVTTITFDGNRLAGCTADNQIWITTGSLDGGNPMWQKLSGELSQISTHFNAIFGTNVRNEVFYGSTNSPTLDIHLTKLAGEFKQVRFDGNYLAGLHPDGQVWVVDKHIRTPVWRSLLGTGFKYVELGNKQLYGVKMDGSVYTQTIIDPVSDMTLYSGTIYTGNFYSLTAYPLNECITFLNHPKLRSWEDNVESIDFGDDICFRAWDDRKCTTNWYGPSTFEGARAFDHRDAGELGRFTNLAGRISSLKMWYC